MPNDLLVKLNIAFCTIKEVGIKPVYDIGEKSKMNVFKSDPPHFLAAAEVIFSSRLWAKYLIRDFSPAFSALSFFHSFSGSYRSLTCLKY